MSQVVENELQVGDLVRVIAPDSLLHGSEGYIAKTDFGAPPNVYLFESDDKQHRCWFSVESLRKLRDNWVLEPPADHIADANEIVPPAIPAGWRELLDGEALSKTDLYRDSGKWVPYVDFDPAGSDTPKYDKTLHYQHIRKIEQWPGHVQGVWVEEAEEKPAFTLDELEELIDRRIAEQIEKENKEADANTSRKSEPTEWIPKVGDRVRVNKPSRIVHGKVGVVIKDDAREYAVRIDGEDFFTSFNLKAQYLELIEAANPLETPNSTTAKRPVVYIAGPMRGIPHFNFPAFDAAKEYLIGKGYDVLSPADFDRELDGFDPYKAEYETAEGCADFPKTMDFKRVVTRDLTAVTQCDAVALLSGWEKSKGAVAEIAVAHWMGKPVMHLLCDANRPNEVVYIVNNDSTTLEQFVLQLAHAHDAYDKRINCAIDTPPPELNPDCDILEVAASITRGDRQAVYGPPDQDFKKTADMWTGMFQYMLAPGAKFEPRHVAMAMICIKLSREFHQRKRDNWIDIAGYARCGSLCSS